MQAGCSSRGANSSARLSWHCSVAFTAVAPKKRAEKLSFCFFDVDFPAERFVILDVTGQATRQRMAATSKTEYLLI